MARFGEADRRRHVRAEPRPTHLAAAAQPHDCTWGPLSGDLLLGLLLGRSRSVSIGDASHSPGHRAEFVEHGGTVRARPERKPYLLPEPNSAPSP